MYRWKKCRIRSLSTPLRIVTENQVFSLLFRLELHWGSPFLGRLAKSIHLVHILGKIHILGSFSNNLPRGHTHCFFSLGSTIDGPHSVAHTGLQNLYMFSFVLQLRIHNVLLSTGPMPKPWYENFTLHRGFLFSLFRFSEKRSCCISLVPTFPGFHCKIASRQQNKMIKFLPIFLPMKRWARRWRSPPLSVRSLWKKGGTNWSASQQRAEIRHH